MNIIYKYNKNKAYKFACVISYKDRSELVKNTFQSLNNSFIPSNLLFIIIDDGSITQIDPELKHDYIFIRKNHNYGISNSLVLGWDIVYGLNIEYMMNLDSDTEVSPNWISVLNNIFSSHCTTDCLVTGYHGSFASGHTNHPITKDHSPYREKNSLGGINIFFHRDLYRRLVRKSLTNYEPSSFDINNILNSVDLYGKNPKLDQRNNRNGWDWSLSILCKEQNISILCPKESVVQHKGVCGISSSIKSFEQSYDYENRCVPKIIHQLWKNENIPDHLLLMQKSVKDHHSDYEYRFWTDEKLDVFVRENYPNLWNFYHTGLQYIIQKIDFVRLLLIYHYGGVYIDLDSLCINNVNNILDYPCSFINTKKHEGFSDKYYPLVLNNAFISAEKQNYFIKKTLVNIINYQDPADYKEYCSFKPIYTKILKSAGPLCITDSYLSYEHKSLINLLPNEYYYGSEYSSGMRPTEIIDYGFNIASKITNCCFIHLHESSWWRKEGVAINPPKNINYNQYTLDKNRSMAMIELSCIQHK